MRAWSSIIHGYLTDLPSQRAARQGGARWEMLDEYSVLRKMQLSRTAHNTAPWQSNANPMGRSCRGPSVLGLVLGSWALGSCQGQRGAEGSSLVITSSAGMA